jgi:ATP cone domain/AF1548-like, C-terminal/Restriction endonuclease
MTSIKIIKANGEKVPFEKEKLIASLTKSGASKPLAQKITEEIEATLYQNITTKEIYKKAFKKLNFHSRAIASRYKLKKAIMELGPTGYPFEKFVGELLKYQGFKVKVGVIVQGHCVQHEVDVVAEKDNKHFMIECKFHSSFTTKCNVKIPLYIHSRFLDVQKKWIKIVGHKHKFHQGWVVNNTRFSEDAIQYANCVNIRLLSWDYPKNGSLKELISLSGLYPITCLNTLKKSEKLELLKKDIVLCKHLCKNPNVLTEIGIHQNRKKKILEDAHQLCNNVILS